METRGHCRAEYTQEAAPDVSTHVQRRLYGRFEEQADRAVPVILMIPIAIVIGLLIPMAGPAIVLMLLFRAKYPRWWFDFNLGWLRFNARVDAYLLLLRDEYPSTTRSRPCTWTSRTRSRAASTGSSTHQVAAGAAALDHHQHPGHHRAGGDSHRLAAHHRHGLLPEGDVRLRGGRVALDAARRGVRRGAVHRPVPALQAWRIERAGSAQGAHAAVHDRVLETEHRRVHRYAARARGPRSHGRAVVGGEQVQA